MAEPTIVDNGALADYDVLVDGVTDPASADGGLTLGTGIVQYMKLMDGTVNGTSKGGVDASGALAVSDARLLQVLEEMLLTRQRNLAGDEIAQPLTRDTDTISAAIATDAVMAGNRPIDPSFVFKNVAASQTDSLLVSCPKGKRIRVLLFRLHTGGTATNVTFNTQRPTGAGTACSELFATAANGGHHGAFSPIGHFQTNIDEDLSVTTGAGSTVGIGLVYITL